MVHTRAAVRTAVGYSQTPAEAIFQANQLVAQEARDGLFVTLFYGRLHTTSGELTFVNAGHNPALHYAARRQHMQALGRTGLPLAILPDAPYAQQVVSLQPGDLLILYTDGVTEAVNGVMEEFGTARLQAIIRQYAAAPATAVVNAIEDGLRNFTGDQAPFDDVTLVVVKATREARLNLP